MEKMFGEFDSGALIKNYRDASKDDNFKRLVSSLDLSDEKLANYTTKLEETVCELSNCSKCKGLAFCKNKNAGYVDYPNVYNKRLIFSLKSCKYTKELEKNRSSKNNICLKDISVDDKRRVPILKWITNFLNDLENGGFKKGLYLHGNFGCGKTFLLSALFNELEKNRGECEIVYFPELLRDLKSDFEYFGGKMEYLKRVDYLLIDDIGAEKVTEWGRDEVLGTILQYRMNNQKVTFFTSNLKMSSLEEHLTSSSTDSDKVKAMRIIERIKYLSEPMELISENRRK